jgi:hypothetical protein
MVTKTGIQPPNLRGGSSRGIERPGNPPEGRFSRSGTHDLRLETLVFDTEKFALDEESRYAATLNTASSAESKDVQEQGAVEQRAWVSCREYLIHTLAGLKTALSARRFEVWTAASVILCIAVAGVLLYIACSDGYRVETKLLLFDRDHNGGNSAVGNLEEEVEILKSPQILHLLSRDLYQEKPQNLAPGGHFQTLRTASSRALSEFSGPDDLEKWLAKRTNVRSTVSGGTARVAVQLLGNDPDFLSSVLDAYICRYVDYRRTLETKSRNQIRHAQLPMATIPAEMISAQLQKIDFQEQGSKLAIQLIDSGKGVFSGFVPDQSLTGVPSLTQFQNKIIQLEIKKKALATQYMPASREITTVDLEIKGVRSAMRECLAEHLEFLKKEKEQLLALNGATRHHGGHPANHDQTANKERCGTQSPGGADSWLVPRDGLYVLRESPVIAQRPLLARTGNFASKLIAYLAPSPAATVVSESNRKKGLSPAHSLSADGRTYNAGAPSQGGLAGKSFEPTHTTPPVWQRAATSYRNASQQGTTQQSTGPSNSRFRQ